MIEDRMFEEDVSYPRYLSGYLHHLFWASMLTRHQLAIFGFPGISESFLSYVPSTRTPQVFSAKILDLYLFPLPHT